VGTSAAKTPSRAREALNNVPGELATHIEGAWSHRSVSANGTRFHVAEAGEGPLVLLLHGFPEFWWTWRNQLTTLAEAGFRAVAADLRGYGASDKPPRGYDLVTAASDAGGLIRALGEANAVVVGHDWGGLVAWTMGCYLPKVVRRLAIVSVPHPLRLRAAVFGDLRGQGRRSGYALGFQLPRLPERRLLDDQARRVGQMLREWSGPGWPDAETERRYRTAMLIPSVAHSALEYHRWFVRSRLRPDGIRYARRMHTPIQVPTLQLHGTLDTCVLPRSARGSSRHVEAPYRWHLIEGAGHFPHEELPERFDAELRGWLADPEPER
jgi:pimeloyl-ACP methyl ester carboxylesterase